MQEQEPTLLEVMTAWISGKPQGMVAVGIFLVLYISPLQKTLYEVCAKHKLQTNSLQWAVSLNAEHSGAACNYSVYGLIRGSERAIYS